MQFESSSKQLSEKELQFLKRAIELSKKSLIEAPGGPFGAVIELNDEIVGEGWNEVTSTFDPTAHAEMQAIRKATKNLGQFHLVGATIYSSCEPCPMCLSAIYWAKITKVVYANTRHEAASIGFSDADIYEQVALPVSQRSIACCHFPSAEASSVFEKWKDKESKMLY